MAWRALGQRLLPPEASKEPMSAEEVDGLGLSESSTTSRASTPRSQASPTNLDIQSIAQIHALDILSGQAYAPKEEDDLCMGRMRATSFVETGADSLSPSVMSRSVSSPHLFSGSPIDATSTGAVLNLSGLSSEPTTPPSQQSPPLLSKIVDDQENGAEEDVTCAAGKDCIATLPCVTSFSAVERALPPDSQGGSLFSKEFGQMGKGGLCLEYAEWGTGDFRSPSFSVTDSYNDSNSSPLMFQSYQIYRGKLPMPDGLPSVRTVDDSEASTLLVTMLDGVSGLQVDLIYTAMHDYDCITRRAVFKNVDSRPLIRRAPTGGPRSFAGSGAASASSKNVLSCDFDHGGGGCRIGPNYGDGAKAETCSPRVGADAEDNEGALREMTSDGSSDSDSDLPRVECYKVLNRAMSMTLDLKQSADAMHLMQLSGSWGRERHKVSTRLEQGMQSFGSMRGVSGHQSNPFCAITHGAPNETKGESFGISLIYSGNFLLECETDEMYRTRINVGIHPSTMQWHLGRGACFNTPETVLVRSAEGLGGMSRTLHRVITDRLIPRTWAYHDPPVLMNSWEQSYFDVDQDTVLRMASEAREIGADLVVVDDGWFINRSSDSTGLGDWRADPAKFPDGLGPLVKKVNDMGIKFGIWLEPEMISKESELNKKHPEWWLSEPGRRSQVSRNQMVLDLSRREVQDYLFDAISLVLREANISYVKWDFNRPLTDVFSCATYNGDASNPRPIFQSETAHRYVLGLYRLQARVLEAFPHILLENCASGGGRFDLGMLYFSPQCWTSDNTDSIVRIRVQHGTSYCYPFRTMGAHISACPNHITGNSTRARTRGFTSMCGTFGFELDVRTLSQDEIALFRTQVQLFKSFSQIIHFGELYRLWDPFVVPLCSWMFVTADRTEAVVFAFSVNSDHWSNLVPPLKLQGLSPDGIYSVVEPLPNNVCQSQSNLRILEMPTPLYQLGHPTVYLTGEILMQAGLPIKFYTLDDSLFFHLQLVS